MKESHDCISNCIYPNCSVVEESFRFWLCSSTMLRNSLTFFTHAPHCHTTICSLNTFRMWKLLIQNYMYTLHGHLQLLRVFCIQYLQSPPPPYSSVAGAKHFSQDSSTHRNRAVAVNTSIMSLTFSHL